jgi:hypothetical protein
MAFKVDADITDKQIQCAAERYCHAVGINQTELIATVLENCRRIVSLEAKVAALEKGTPPHLVGIERR